MSISLSPKAWIALFVVLAAATIVAEAIVVQLPGFGQNPDLLSFAVTFDLTVGIPLAYYLMVSQKLHVTLASALVVFLVCTGLAGVISAPAVLGIVVNEISTVRYGLLFWLGGQEVRPEQKCFTTHKESGYVAVWAVLFFVLVIETVGLHLLLLQWSPVAAFVSTGLSMYSLVFFVADLASMVKRPIVLHDGQLLFRIGIRWNAMIAREDIRRLTPIRDFDKAKEKDTLLCAPGNAPNLLLELHRPVTVTGFFGIRRHTQRIALHADDPAGLIREAVGNL